MNIIRDFNYALRLLAKTPAYSMLSILVVALGIGLALNIYSSVSQLAYSKVGVINEDRLVTVDVVENGLEMNGGNIWPYDIKYLLDRTQSFEKVTSYRSYATNLSGREYAMRLRGAAVDNVLFELNPQAPLMGRSFEPSDALPGADLVVVLSHRLWQDYFGGEADIVGKTVELSGTTREIIGVMPASFRWPVNEELWTNLIRTPEPQPGEGWGQVIVGWLKPDVSIAEADDELKQFALELEAEHPQFNANLTFKVWPYTQVSMANSMTIIYVMIATGVFIFLLACANMTNLLIVRSGERMKELAVRRAAGAPRTRLVRQLMTETAIICFIGALIGLSLTVASFGHINAAIAQIGSFVPYWWRWELTPQLVVVAALFAVFTSLLTGAIPAVKASSVDVNERLRDGTRGAQTRASGKAMKALVIFEITISIALLIASSVLISGMIRVTNLDYGVERDNMFKATISMTGERYAEDEAKVAAWTQIIEGLERRGVKTTMSDALAGQYAPGGNYRTEAMSVDETTEYPKIGMVTVANNYLSLAGAKMIEGRNFDINDTADSEQVAIISDRAAKQIFGEQSAIDQRIELKAGTDRARWVRIVGVVGHIIQGQPFGTFERPAVYLPLAQEVTRYGHILIDLDATDGQKIDLIRKVVSEMDPTLPPSDMRSLDSVIKSSVAGMRFLAENFAVYALVTLLLAVSGIYGVMSRAVALKTHEIGVRRAVGADDRDIIKQFMREGYKQFAVGAALGLPVAILMINGIASVLNVSGNIYLLAATVFAIIFAVVCLAVYIPAKRAVAIEPTAALRYE